MRVLIVRLGAIGDALRVLPALRRLRVDLPDSEIGWAVESWVHPVVRGNPNVDRFHVLDRAALRGGGAGALREIRRFVADVRSRRYDVAVDLQGRLKSGIVSWLSGCRTRIGYARGDGSEGSFLFANHRVRLPDARENRVQRFLHALEPLGIRPEIVPGDFGVAIDAGERLRARSWYESVGCPPIAAYPGSSRKRARYQRWQSERWAALLGRLGDAGHPSVIFWGPTEEPYVREIIAATPGGAATSCRLAPATTLPEMMAMLGCFRLFVGSNTGAMHMSWLQRVPTVFFPGPALPRTDAPCGGVPYRALWAERCFSEKLPRDRQAGCVREVTVDEAERAVLELLAAG
jgi:heptosyltransferase I